MEQSAYTTLDILREDMRLYGEGHDCYVFYKKFENGLILEIHLMPDEVEEKDLLDLHVVMPLKAAYALFSAQMDNEKP